MRDHRSLHPHPSSGSIAGAATVTVAASCDTLWNVISNVDYAAEVPEVISVEVLNDSKRGEFRVGTKWRETRVCKDGKTVVSTTTIVRMTCGDEVIAKDPTSFPRSVSFATSFEKPRRGIITSSTLTVKPCDDRKGHSILEGTFAAIPARFIDKVKWTLRCSCFRTNVIHSYGKDLDQIAEAAARIERSSFSEEKM